MTHTHIYTIKVKGEIFKTYYGAHHFQVVLNQAFGLADEIKWASGEDAEALITVNNKPLSYWS